MLHQHRGLYHSVVAQMRLAYQSQVLVVMVSAPLGVQPCLTHPSFMQFLGLLRQFGLIAHFEVIPLRGTRRCASYRLYLSYVQGRPALRCWSYVATQRARRYVTYPTLLRLQQTLGGQGLILATVHGLLTIEQCVGLALGGVLVFGYSVG